MSDAARYRQKARDFEQRENWKRAIEAYELAIQADKSSRRKGDLALYNRVGDLYRRIGDVNKAVEYYELAADGHLSAGYYNNAIALCNKILRNQPNRHSAYLKLGKIGAAKGFLSDAKKHFLEYAERMQKSGKLDEAFSALIEFASLSPDPEVRLMIADQLIEHKRTDMAVDQLRLAWLNLSEEGREADAEEVRSRILELNPDRDPEVHRPEDSAVTELDAEGIIDLPELLPYDEPEKGTAAEETDVEPEIGLEPGSAVMAEEETETGAPELEALDLEPTGFEVDEEEVEEGEDAGVESSELDSLDVSADELAEGERPDDTPGSLDVMPTALGEAERGIDAGEEAPGEESGLEIVPTSLASAEDVEEETAAALEVEEGSGDEEAVSGESVVDASEASAEGSGGQEAAAVAEVDAPAAPIEEAVATPAGRVAELETRIDAEGRKPDLLIDLAEALLETGGREKSIALLEEAVEVHEARGRFREAGRVLNELLRLNVNDIKSYQKRIELALRAGDRVGTIEAYLGLADCLDRTDAGNKAKVVYQRVLELDPGNQRASAALELFGGQATAEPAAGVGQRSAAEQPSQDYVDLGSLVAEELEEKSTRFVVSAGDPQSESDVNFSEMLDQFKSKVAEAIEKEDASSHYDLACAFKDMGLVDEAIAEFQIAARSPDYRLRAIEMLGDCFLEKQDYRIGLKVLSRALQMPGYKDEDLIGIFYAMGRAYEAVGEPGTAVEWYERVLGCDLKFRDVSERISALRQ